MALLIVAVVSALQLTRGDVMAQERCDYLKVAQDFIAGRYPSFDATGKRPVISEDSNVWRLTFELPPTMLGGAPVITIDKRTCAVIGAEHTQ